VTGTCAPYVQWKTWTADFKSGVLNFALASMDSLQNWFFWTWKVSLSFHRCELPDIDIDSNRASADWPFGYLGRSGVTAMELFAWTHERLDSERPTHGLREVQGVRRW